MRGDGGRSQHSSPVVAPCGGSRPVLLASSSSGMMTPMMAMPPPMMPASAPPVQQQQQAVQHSLSPPQPQLRAAAGPPQPLEVQAPGQVAWEPIAVETPTQHSLVQSLMATGGSTSRPASPVRTAVLRQSAEGDGAIAPARQSETNAVASQGPKTDAPADGERNLPEALAEDDEAGDAAKPVPSSSTTIVAPGCSAQIDAAPRPVPSESSTIGIAPGCSSRVPPSSAVAALSARSAAEEKQQPQPPPLVTSVASALHQPQDEALPGVVIVKQASCSTLGSPRDAEAPQPQFKKQFSSSSLNSPRQSEVSTVRCTADYVADLRWAAATAAAESCSGAGGAAAARAMLAAKAETLSVVSMGSGTCSAGCSVESQPPALPCAVGVEVPEVTPAEIHTAVADLADKAKIPASISEEAEPYPEPAASGSDFGAADTLQPPPQRRSPPLAARAFKVPPLTIEAEKLLEPDASEPLISAAAAALLREVNVGALTDRSDKSDRFFLGQEPSPIMPASPVTDATGVTPMTEGFGPAPVANALVSAAETLGPFAEAQQRQLEVLSPSAASASTLGVRQRWEWRSHHREEEWSPRKSLVYSPTNSVRSLLTMSSVATPLRTPTAAYCISNGGAVSAYHPGFGPTLGTSVASASSRERDCAREHNGWRKSLSPPRGSAAVGGNAGGTSFCSGGSSSSSTSSRAGTGARRSGRSAALSPRSPGGGKASARAASQPVLGPSTCYNGYGACFGRSSTSTYSGRSRTSAGATERWRTLGPRRSFGSEANRAAQWCQLYADEVGRAPANADQLRAFVLNRGGELSYCVARMALRQILQL